MKILLLSKYSRMGASSRLRALQYLPHLEADGFEITVSSLFDDEYLHSLYKQNKRTVMGTARSYLQRLVVLLSSYKYDLIWVEKEIFPFLPAFAERLLRLFGKAYIVDYDDAIFHSYDMSRNPIIRHLLGGKIDTVKRHSACVIAGNDYLASRARSAGALRIEHLPTVVDYSRYKVKSDSHTDRPVIGWIGSPSTQKYVVNIRDSLVRACHRHRARLLLVGATPQVAADLQGLDIEIVPWSEESEAEMILRMDIGIMPLPDGPWEKGKCGYKLIQYMACAIPVVASPVGVNVDIVNDSQSGFLADNPSDWENALLQLLESPSLRVQMGAAGRKAVETTYSLQAQAPVLSRILTEAITKESA